MINSFRGKYRFLSNFWPCDGDTPEYPLIIKLGNFSFPSVEHAYQAAKTDSDLIRSAFIYGSGKKVKKMGRLLEKTPNFSYDEWNNKKLGIMEDLVRQKFQDTNLKALLLATGDEEIVEGNTWNDTFWGVCKGVGYNHLGKILMKIREELKNEENL